jgi:hypothetical protein
MSQHDLSKQSAAISQLHPLGCAVACVAYRAGVSYEDASHFFLHQEYAWTRGYYSSEVVEALAVGGWQYAFSEYESSVHSMKLSKEGTIVFVEPCTQYPAGHFFIRATSGWMNPWANFPLMDKVRADFQDQLPARVTYIIFEMPL